MPRPTLAAPRRTRREIGLIAIAVFAIVASVLAVAFTPMGPDVDQLAVVFRVYGTLMFSFVGVVILWRRPGHGLGRLALLIGMLFAASSAIGALLEWARPSVGARELLSGPVQVVYDITSNVSLALMVAGLLFGVTLLVAWFPDGHRTSRLGAVVELALGAGIVLIAIATLRAPILETIGWSRSVNDAFTLGEILAIPMFLGAWIGAVVDLARRYRRATDPRRTQMRWVLVASAISAALPVAVIFLGDRIPALYGLAIIGLGLPVLAVAIAIVRYHLYDIDRIVSRSIAYLAITAVLFGVFALVNLGVTQALTGALPDGARTIGVALSTLAVASIFQPLRRRVQRAVDRRFHRSRYDAQRVVDGFAARLRDDVELAGLERELVMAANQAVEPTITAVWIRRGATA